MIAHVITKLYLIYPRYPEVDTTPQFIDSNVFIRAMFIESNYRGKLHKMDRRQRWTTAWLATRGENRRSRDVVVVSRSLDGWNEIIKRPQYS